MNNSSCDGGGGRRVPLDVGAFIEISHAINSVKSDSSGVNYYLSLTVKITSIILEMDYVEQKNSTGYCRVCLLKWLCKGGNEARKARF